jgi:hypothetical protein
VTRQQAERLARPALVAGLLCALLAGCDNDVRSPAAAAPPAAERDRDRRAPVLAPVALPDVAQQGDGVLHIVPATAPPPAGARVRRYLVEVEGGLGIDPASFALAADATLGDPRSWSAARRPLHRVDTAPVDFRLALASPALTDRLCAPLRTGGRYSCFQRGRAVVNSLRWLTGAPAYAGRLEEYRHYVVNHEVGHALGNGHAQCPGRGKPAPVMMQQTKGVGACTPSAWPFP